MDPTWLRDTLRGRGLPVLFVGRDVRSNDVLTVYMQGNPGQFDGGDAQAICLQVPGVLQVTYSEQTNAILLVRTEPVPARALRPA